jgi:hypothetical protein
MPNKNGHLLNKTPLKITKIFNEISDFNAFSGFRLNDWQLLPKVAALGHFEKKNYNRV